MITMLVLKTFVTLIVVVIIFKSNAMITMNVPIMGAMPLLAAITHILTAMMEICVRLTLAIKTLVANILL
jgi:hypothetical protein